MSASFFFILNAFIIIFLVSRIISAGMNRSRPSLKREEASRSGRPEFFDIFTNASAPREKSLNCHFVWEGQTLDAYEVLKVPAGAPLEICRQAFRELTGKTDPQRPLFEAAIKALETHRFS